MKKNYNDIINILSKTALCLSLILSSSCSNDLKKSGKILSPKIDPNIGSGYEDYRQKLTDNNHTIDKSISSLPPIPEFSRIISKAKMPSIASDKLVTIAVTEDIPLKDVLIELSRTADVDMELDHNIVGGIILKVKNKPFSEVIERICSLANLRFYNNNGVLKIERDIAYLDNYALDFLNINRSNSNTSQISTSMKTSSESGGSGSSAQGSTSSLKSSYDGDLWLSVENDVKKNIINWSFKRI